MRNAILMLLLAVAVGISAGTEPMQAQESDPWQPVIDAIEASPIENMTIVIGTADGEQFRYTKGDFSATDPYPIASASKWYTAALTMQLVEAGLLSLDDHPQDYLDFWTDDPSDPRSQITVEQMLAFTTGYGGNDADIPCLSDGDTTNEACLQAIYDDFFVYEPGSTFYYGPIHMAILGAMIEAITGQSFNQAFRAYIGRPLGLSLQTGFYLPSDSNPRPAGGATSTVNDYYRFIEAMATGDILADSQAEMFVRHTPDGTVFEYRPPSIGERGWQYALGTWVTCENEEWTDDCEADYLLTSPGAFGWAGYIDPFDGHFGLIAQRGEAVTRGTFTDPPAGQSIELLLTIEPLIDEIVAESGQ